MSGSVDPGKRGATAGCDRHRSCLVPAGRATAATRSTQVTDTTAPDGTVTHSRPGYPRAGAAEVTGHPDFPAVEKQVLAYWAKDKTFQASVDARPAGENGDNEYGFY